MLTNRAILVFSNRTIDSSGTITSTPIKVGRAQFASFQYEYNSESTGAYAVASANILCSASSIGAGFLAPQDDAGDDLSYIGQVDSGSRFIAFDFPMSEAIQIQVKSVTNTSIVLDALWAVFDDVV